MIACVFKVLKDILKLGPELLLSVDDWYTMCVDSGLIVVPALRSLVALLSILCNFSVCSRYLGICGCWVDVHHCAVSYIPR